MRKNNGFVIAAKQQILLATRAGDNINGFKQVTQDEGIARWG